MARLLVHHSDRVLYVDETTFNSFTVLKRSWSTKEDPNMHAGAQKRFSTTIFGAIGQPLA